MTKDYQESAIIATHSTLKSFIIIGIIIGAIGTAIYLFFTPFIGTIVITLGIIIIAICTISLLYLWLTERILPQPK